MASGVGWTTECRWAVGCNGVGMGNGDLKGQEANHLKGQEGSQIQAQHGLCTKPQLCSLK